MKSPALILGDGVAGLLLALGLRDRGFDVILLSRPLQAPSDSPLICPQLVLDFFQRLDPRLVTDLVSAGSILRDHQALLREKFPGLSGNASSVKSFLFLSRGLLLQKLRSLARERGVSFLAAEFMSLVVDNGEVRGVQTEASALDASLVFDCTGASSPPERRSEIGDVLYQRFYRSSDRPVLALRSVPGRRGGLYPVEGNRFALSLTLAEDPGMDGIGAVAENFLETLGKSGDLRRSEPEGPWVCVRRETSASAYYENSTLQIRGYYPVGEKVLASPPIYGRGISLAVLQMAPALTSIHPGSSPEEIFKELKKGFREAKKKWQEVAERRSFGQGLVTNWGLELLEKYPAAYERYLEFYQLERSPMKLFLSLIVARLSSRSVSASRSQSPA